MDIAAMPRMGIAMGVLLTRAAAGLSLLTLGPSFVQNKTRRSASQVGGFA